MGKAFPERRLTFRSNADRNDKFLSEMVIFDISIYQYPIYQYSII